MHRSVCATRVVLHSKYGKLALDETRRARIDRHRPLTPGKRLEKQTMIVCEEKTNRVNKKHVTREGITKRISNNRLYSLGVPETNSERNM